jgi:Fe2+ or Zn2+ uptake regulation protein
MNRLNGPIEDQRCNQQLATLGLRSTPQRREVFHILLQQRDHPTANEVYLRAKRIIPEISMATVYNCLDALVQSGLVRQVSLDRGASRYCPNMQDHGHFYCNRCGAVYDVQYKAEPPQTKIRVPVDFQVTHYELSVRGLCASCSEPHPARPSRRQSRLHRNATPWRGRP